MSQPVTFSVAAAVRQGAFQTGTLTKAGQTQIYWELNIPDTAEYENTANSATFNLLVNGAVHNSVSWAGGPATGKGGVTDPVPAFFFDFEFVPDGAGIQITGAIANSMTIGIQNGVLN